MEFLTRFKNSLFLIAALLAQAIALAVQVPVGAGAADGRSVRLIRMWATSTVTPFERAAHAIGSGVGKGWSDYVALRHVRQQNKDLTEQLTRMRIEEASIAEDALQGRRLQAMLGFRERYVGSTVAAQVIGDSGSEQTRVLTIDKGSRDGLKPDMAVITQDGIVGKLRDVFPATAQVLEINDQTSGAGVILESTRLRAILRGAVGGRVQIGNLSADSRIQPGEQIITSGGDQVYPRGLPVGTVVSIAPDPEHQPYTKIVVRPAVNLDRVEEVLVITGTQSDLLPLAQQDLATAEAQHAADQSAEHLPGIHDDQTGSAAAGLNLAPDTKPVTATSPSGLVIPHPLPVVHPDNYTTGSVPPASQLIPGGANSSQGSSSAAKTPASQPPGNHPNAQQPASQQSSPKSEPQR